MVRVAIFDHHFNGPVYQLIKTLFANVITKDVTARNTTMRIGDDIEVHFHVYAEDKETVSGQFDFILCRDFTYSVKDKWADFLRTKTPTLRVIEI
jgi:hypothetical protein